MGIAKGLRFRSLELENAFYLVITVFICTEPTRPNPKWFLSVNSPELIVVGLVGLLGLVGLMLWLVPGLALTKSKINSGELTDKYLQS